VEYARTQRRDAGDAEAEAALMIVTSAAAAWKETLMAAGNATPSHARRVSLPARNGKGYA